MKKKYLTDSKTNKFNSKITSIKKYNGKYAVRLEETYFFPSGGGQLCDKGTIDGISVIDFVEIDSKMYHVLDSVFLKNIGDIVVGIIEFRYRFELMQQHTGQHILSQCLERTLNLQTLSFQMKKEISQIKVYYDSEKVESLIYAEELANNIVYKCIPLEILNVDISNIDSFNLRKKPLKKHVDEKGEIRIIKISDFEEIPCGGTHCDHTGEVGMIKIVNIKKVKKYLFIDFVCGYRAFKIFDEKLKLLKNLQNIQKTNEQQLLNSVIKSHEKNNILHKKHEDCIDNYLELYAEKIVINAELVGGVKCLHYHIKDMGFNDVIILAGKLIKDNSMICLLFSKNNFILKTSLNLNFDVNAVFKKISENILVRGGGSSNSFKGKVINKNETESFSKLFYNSIISKIMIT